MFIQIDVRRIENRPIQQPRPNQVGFLSRHKVVTVFAVGVIAALAVWYYKSLQCYNFWDCPTSRGICETPDDLQWCKETGSPAPIKGYPVVCLCPENVGKPPESLPADQRYPSVLPENHSCFRFFRMGRLSFFSQLYCFLECLGGENDPLKKQALLKYGKISK